MKGASRVSSDAQRGVLGIARQSRLFDHLLKHVVKGRGIGVSQLLAQRERNAIQDLETPLEQRLLPLGAFTLADVLDGEQRRLLRVLYDRGGHANLSWLSVVR